MVADCSSLTVILTGIVLLFWIGLLITCINQYDTIAKLKREVEWLRTEKQQEKEKRINIINEKHAQEKMYQDIQKQLLQIIKEELPQYKIILLNKNKTNNDIPSFSYVSASSTKNHTKEVGW